MAIIILLVAIMLPIPTSIALRRNTTHYRLIIFLNFVVLLGLLLGFDQQCFLVWVALVIGASLDTPDPNPAPKGTARSLLSSLGQPPSRTTMQ
jgi:hypothetical protein